MDKNYIEEAKKHLENAKLIAIPTETVYGLAANALDLEAVTKIFEAKNRPTFDPLIVHTHSLEIVRTFTKKIPKQAEKLAQKFWPGALTLLLPKQDIIPDLVTAGLETVAVRIPKHKVTLDLLKNLPFPLAAPSANPFGYISPTTSEHVQAQLGDKVALILEGGSSEIGIESTIVGFPDGMPTVFRLGGISVEAIESEIGKVEIEQYSNSNPTSPGMLKSHYAPKKPFEVVDIRDELDSTRRSLLKIGVLSFRTSFSEVPLSNQVVLSQKGDLAEAAQRLFAGMRYLDALDIDIIFAELLPEEGLGRAINDRIRRAAA